MFVTLDWHKRPFHRRLMPHAAVVDPSAAMARAGVVSSSAALTPAARSDAENVRLVIMRKL
jgi:hypothetical protein